MRRALVALGAAAALAAAGCGYTMGSGLRDQGIRTVALDVVGNDTYRQRLEVELGAALARELPVSSDLTLATRSRADATLAVVLQDAGERTLVLGVRNDALPLQSDPVREGAFDAAVWLRLVDRSGKVVVERRITDRTEFRTSIGEDLTSARKELVEDLARKIALALESDV